MLQFPFQEYYDNVCDQNDVGVLGVLFRVLSLFDRGIMLVFCLEFWPRLIVDEQKPAWLKVNFDRWQSEDATDSEKEEEEEQQAKLEVSCVLGVQ